MGSWGWGTPRGAGDGAAVPGGGLAASRGGSPSCGGRRCLAGLETFVSVAKELPTAQLYDVVEGYVKISVECAEIFKLLDGERKPESEVSPEHCPDWEQH